MQAMVDNMNFSSFVKDTYILAQKCDGNTYKHALCRSNNNSSAICPNCDSKLIKLLQLDMSDPQLSLSKLFSNIIVIYYCFRCAIIEAPFYYKIRSDYGVEILDYKKNLPGYSPSWLGNGPFEEWEQLEYYPEVPLQLNKASDDQSRYLLAHFLNRRIDINLVDNSLQHYLCNERYDDDEYLPQLRNIIGGIPFLQYIWEFAPFICPQCGENMPFLLTIGEPYIDCNGNEVSYTGELVQIVSAFCSKCNVVGVAHENWY
jgi:hypothetical protein